MQKWDHGRVNVMSFGFKREKTYSVFSEPTLHRFLQQRMAKDLYFCGVPFEYHLGKTMRDAAAQGYKVFLLKDCVMGIDEDRVDEMSKRIRPWVTTM